MNQAKIFIHALAATVLLLTGCATTSSSPLLNTAARNGDLAALQQLLDRGADINARDSDQFTPLMVAAGCGQSSCLKLLLDRGADINATTWKWQSALIIAAEDGQAECVRLLLARGAKTEQRAVFYYIDGGIEKRADLTAMERAKSCGHPEIVTIFQEYAREQTRLREAPFIAALAKASLPELLSTADPSVSLARARNDAIIAAKTRDLPKLLHDDTSADLTALCVCLEQTILGLNHECEVAKDKAQQAAANGDPQQLDELRGLSICYRERIEILKPILAALKEEIANRGR